MDAVVIGAENSHPYRAFSIDSIAVMRRLIPLTPWRQTRPCQVKMTLLPRLTSRAGEIVACKAIRVGRQLRGYSGF
jgi:hypothetical protein